MSRRINWMVASFTCSSIMFMPLAADGAGCWALSSLVATNAAVAKQSRKAMFFIKLDSPSQEYGRAGSENGTGTSDRRLEESISELNVTVLRPEGSKIS
jgi:hypothetical protein